MFYVYILKSVQSRQFYVGHTNNLDRRLKEHRSGRTQSLKGRGYYQLLYFEKYQVRDQAVSREKYLKSGAGRKDRSSLIADFPQELIRKFNV